MSPIRFCYLILVSIFLCNSGTDAESASEMQQLSDLVQKRIHSIQNPKDCSTARKVACRLDERRGYGCQVHQIVFCLIAAYATERTLVMGLNESIWTGFQWNETFLPLSDTCLNYHGATHGNWSTTASDVQVLHIPRISLIKPTPEFTPLAIPADLAPQLSRLHPDPAAWWIGQFVQYVLRYQPATQEMIDRVMTDLQISSGPIVGVHVRRTDKISEAEFHDLPEYMAVVKDYYNRKSNNGSEKVKPRIFLASDEPTVIAEAMANYPEYEVINNANGTKSAAFKTRYTKDSLYGAIVDTHILSRTDYMVCTFSSNVGRLAYVMKMVNSPETALDYTSLDKSFYFAGSKVGREIVKMPTYPDIH